MVAQGSGHFELLSIFTEAISGELSAWPFRLLVIPATKSQPIRGHMVVPLRGFEELLVAGCFIEFVSALDSKDRGASVEAASKALLAAAEDLDEAKVAKMRSWLRQAGGVDPDDEGATLRHKEG
jgi:hypothetical protein